MHSGNKLKFKNIAWHLPHFTDSNTNLDRFFILEIYFDGINYQAMCAYPMLLSNYQIFHNNIVWKNCEIGNIQGWFDNKKINSFLKNAYNTNA